MQFATTTLIAVAAALVAAESSRMPWQCHKTCGQSLTAYNKCKGAANSKHCLCASGSQFKTLVGSCLKCGDAAWADYGHALTAPMKKCGITRPKQKRDVEDVEDESGPETDSDSEYGSDSDEEQRLEARSDSKEKLVKKAKKAIKKAQEKQQKANEKLAKYNQNLAEKGEKEAARAKKDALKAQAEADKAKKEAREKAAKAGIKANM